MPTQNELHYLKEISFSIWNLNVTFQSFQWESVLKKPPVFKITQIHLSKGLVCRH